jgi:hypothetical protein
VDFVSDSWREFERQISSKPITFWWRDDDAAQPSPALKRLLALSAEYEIPLALAVVPLAATPELFSGLGDRVSVLQHGTDHRNRAGPGQKKTEFPDDEPVDAVISRLSAAAARLKDLAAARALPVLVPPWNRWRSDLATELAAVGFRGLSTYGRRTAQAVGGLKQVNTHVDIVDWHAGRSFIGDARALRLVLDSLESKEPVGWLTHHAVHDEAAWNFLERLFSLRSLRWARAEELFSYNAPSHG